MNNTDFDIMEIAIQEAELALRKDNFPVGAVLLINKIIVGKAHNQNRELKSLCHHAENSLLMKYSSLIKNAKRKGDLVELYTTLEPCLYCFGGLLQHGIKRLVYSASDPVVGACAILPHLNQWYMDKRIVVENNILTEKYLPILRQYNEKYYKYDWSLLIEANKSRGKIN